MQDRQSDAGYSFLLKQRSLAFFLAVISPNFAAIFKNYLGVLLCQPDTGNISI